MEDFIFFSPLMPTLFKRLGYHGFFLPLIPTLFKCRGYHGFFLSLIPTFFMRRGYHGFFLSLIPTLSINYYPCQGQSALSMPNFNEASLSDTLQLVYSYKILWETGSLIPFYIGHYYNNQSSHQWLLLLRKKLPISLI